MSDNFHVVIPARLASERLPGKVLRDIAGLPMIVRVARACASSGAASVTVAADDALSLSSLLAAPAEGPPADDAGSQEVGPHPAPHGIILNGWPGEGAGWCCTQAVERSKGA